MNTNDKKLEVLRSSNEESNRITKESIQTALIYLMNKKDISNITVTELVKRAGVSRAAFYRNYTSTTDVLIDFSQNVLDLLASSLSNDDFINNIHAWYVFLFNQIKKNSKIMSLLLKAKIDFSTQLIKLTHENDNIIEYKIIALTKGLFAIINKWLDDEMKETPEEMASLCEELFVQTNIFLKQK